MSEERNLLIRDVKDVIALLGVSIEKLYYIGDEVFFIDKKNPLASAATDHVGDAIEILMQLQEELRDAR
jgi:hypothetical protein